MMRILYTVAGTIALVLGILGVFLPLLPATPFLLLAAFCFLRGSHRMHQRLLSHRLLGPPVRDYQSGQGVSLHNKCLALATAWLSMAASAWVVPVTWVRWLLLVPAIGLAVYLWRIPTKHPEAVRSTGSNEF